MKSKQGFTPMSIKTTAMLTVLVKGLTTDQVGETFDVLYGKKYSTSQVSRMFDKARDEIKAWPKRSLLNHYPIVYIDCVFLPTRLVDAVTKETYYVLLGVRPDRTREV